MGNRKTLVILLACLLVMTVLLSVVSCSPTPVPPTSAPAVQPTSPPATAVPAAPPPTAAPPAAPALAPGSSLRIKLPGEESLIQIVPVAANAAGDPNVITATFQYITSTQVGPARTTAAMGATGLPNAPINVPMNFKAKTDPKNPPAKVAWGLLVPPGSKATLASANTPATKFTPDVVGIYALTVALTDAKNVVTNDIVQIHAGTYIGVTDGNCVQCHAAKVSEWQKTGHATIFADEVDNKRDGPQNVATHYSESCTRCHTTGWFAPPIGVGNGGFVDAKTKANWTFPTFDKIDGAWAKKNPSNWDTAPAPVKNMGNIQCEACHGPASDHVLKGSPIMVSSQNEGVCNVCHNGGGNHIKGTELQNAKHANGTSFEEAQGPTRQACVRCHSGDGYATFLKDPQNQAGWANEYQPIVCATCHDPHDEKYPFQLRIAGKPVEITFDAKDVGLSATCYECHNARNKPADAVRSAFPHYSSVAEFISDTGGVEYGQKIVNSPHGQLVGVAPIPNPAFAKDPAVNQFFFSKIGDKKGNTPGACVTCHMWAGPTDAKDPNRLKVGEHTFNTVNPDGKTDYTAACQSCHAGIKDFNLPAKADYDGNGKAEGDQDEVKGLLNTLWKALEAKGFKQTGGNPYATWPRDAQGNTDDKLDNAWFNFRTVYGVMWSADATGKIVPGNEGKAQAVHNFKRAVMLLQLSIKDLTGSMPAGAVEMK